MDFQGTSYLGVHRPSSRIFFASLQARELLRQKSAPRSQPALEGVQRADLCPIPLLERCEVGIARIDILDAIITSGCSARPCEGIIDQTIEHFGVSVDQLMLIGKGRSAMLDYRSMAAGLEMWKSQVGIR